ncbi:MAG: ribosomal L7Ae/L30e/S12e/Gadd45 family protein [Clostridia bacterium]|nr:ribosomal L7Ae/L30e/S12e/Gadd45 family protein [Clostridia bacterium]
MERIKTSTHVVGLKQTKKAIESNKAQLVFIAQDADSYVVFPLEKLCEEKSVEIVYVSSMKELGKACHIDVPTAVATIVKDA